MQITEKNKCFRHIAEDIRCRITEHEFKENERLPSLRILAEQYNSSVNTVAKALKSLEAENVVTSKERVGIIVSPSEHTSAKLIAACVITIDNPLWMSLLRGAEDVFRSQGYSMIVISHDRNSEKLLYALSDLRKVNLDGMLVAPIQESRLDRDQFESIMQTLQESKTPITFIDRNMAGFNVPYVTGDNMSSAYKLTNMLMDKGHKRIGFVRTSHVSTVEERFSGYRQALFDAGMNEDDINDMFVDMGTEDFATQFDRFSDEFKKFLEKSGVTALFTANDQVAKAVLRVLDEKKLNVPEDLSMVSFDVNNIINQTARHITGVNQNFFEMGKQAADILLRQIRGEAIQPSIGQVVPSEIIDFGSVCEPKM